MNPSLTETDEREIRLENLWAWGGHSLEQWDGPATILWVEDEPFVRDVTCEILRSAGYRVLVARNAEEAVEIYGQRGHEVDLLLTDVILPGATGRVLAGRLRRAESALKVLYVTGYAEQMGVCSLENEDCLAKPFSTSALLETLRGMLDRPETPRERGAMLACVGA